MTVLKTNSFKYESVFPLIKIFFYGCNGVTQSITSNVSEVHTVQIDGVDSWSG